MTANGDGDGNGNGLTANGDGDGDGNGQRPTANGDGLTANGDGDGSTVNSLQGTANIQVNGQRRRPTATLRRRINGPQPITNNHLPGRTAANGVGGNGGL